MSQIKGQMKIDGVKVRSPNRPKTEPTPETIIETTTGKSAKKISEPSEIILKAKNPAKKAAEKIAEELPANSIFDGQMILDDFVKAEYDIVQSFKRIEEKLLDDMMKHLDADRLTSVDKFKVNQLLRLEQYRRENLKTYTPIFNELNEKMEKLIRSKFYQGLSKEEKRIMKAIQNGYSPIKLNSEKTRAAFELNTKKLEALIKATMNDMKKAEQAILRKADDMYRQIIFDAQVALNTESMTYKQAIDMATKDFVAAGIQSVTYKNGAVHKISDYCDMAIKTADKRAYLYGEGQMRREFGCYFVIVGKRGSKKPCKCCEPYIGKILIDDVYTGLSKSEARKLKRETGYILLSEAMKNGLYHPRCKDIHTTYFPELNKKPKPLTNEEKKKNHEEEAKRQKANYVNRQVEKYERLAKHSKDSDNKQKYKAKAKEWKKQK